MFVSSYPLFALIHSCHIGIHVKAECRSTKAQVCTYFRFGACVFPSFFPFIHSFFRSFVRSCVVSPFFPWSIVLMSQCHWMCVCAGACERARVAKCSYWDLINFNSNTTHHTILFHTFISWCKSKFIFRETCVHNTCTECFVYKFVR